MNSVRIVADSGCDLPPALAEEYQITIIPVFVRFGQEMISSDDLTRASITSVERPGSRSPKATSSRTVFANICLSGN